jgi:D-alanyl-D-alanine carboxypeptidase
LPQLPHSAVTSHCYDENEIITGGIFMRKRILALLCAATFIGSLLAGCVDKNKTSEPDSNSSAQGITSIRRTDGQNLSSARNGSEDWMLTLVNADNPLSDDYSPTLKSLDNGLQFDERAADKLNAMLSAMRMEGLSPFVCSAYRSVEKQQRLYNDKVEKLISSGLNRDQAAKEARRCVAYPGTSEHNLGLAADIVSTGYQLLDDKQADTPEVKWLMEHCAEYGFILRYPKGKTEVTGVIYEPWHYRYVGAAAAKEIMESGICLEEYLTR